MKVPAGQASAERAVPARVLVVDDEPLARERLAGALAELDGYVLAGSCEDGLAAVRAIEEQHPDIVLLDVEMPGLDGFGVVEAVGAARMPPVVFVTAHDRYAVRAFGVAALDYVTKPWDRPRLESALERARTLLRSREEQRLAERLDALLDARRAQGSHRLAVRSGRRIVLLERERVDWVRGAGNYVRVVADGEEYLVRAGLDLFARRLGAGFLRIHRSHAVRLSAVREVLPDGAAGHSVRLEQGQLLPVGERYHADLMRALGAS